ncbi:MAG TPA: hypothetical protein PLI79_05670 [Mycobacterium sp.]|nr:hypothetical protein [Mycobacterium sp.]
MKPIANKLIAGLAIASAVTGGMLASTGTANARTTLGNVTLPDVIAWCDTHNARPLNGNDPYSWRCTAANSGAPVHGVNMNAVCDRKFGSPAWSDLGGRRTAYSWYCWR